MLELIRKISAAHGVTGCEKKASDVICAEIAKYTDEQYNEYVDPRIIDIMKEKVNAYNTFCNAIETGLIPQDVRFQEELQEEKKRKYLEILYSNPAGFELTARLTTNYRCLKNIYIQRHDHRLPEWREFCAWIETLPYFKEICLED